jgi:hypothetical protein
MLHERGKARASPAPTAAKNPRPCRADPREPDRSRRDQAALGSEGVVPTHHNVVTAARRETHRRLIYPSGRDAQLEKTGTDHQCEWTDEFLCTSQSI